MFIHTHTHEPTDRCNRGNGGESEREGLGFEVIP